MSIGEVLSGSNCASGVIRIAIPHFMKIPSQRIDQGATVPGSTRELLATIQCFGRFSREYDTVGAFGRDDFVRDAPSDPN